MASHKEGYPRLFLAIPVRGMAGEYLQQLCGELKPLFREHQVSWTPPEKLHLTLHYFGKVSGEGYAVIEGIIDRLLCAYSSFDLTLGEPVLFPRPTRPRLIACEVQACKTLENLVADLRQQLDRAGKVVQARPFRAHITLGRLKRLPEGRQAAGNARCMQESLEKERQRLRSKTDFSFAVDEVTLYNSVTGAGGAAYHELRRWPLQNKA